MFLAIEINMPTSDSKVHGNFGGNQKKNSLAIVIKLHKHPQINKI